ncbi:MAG: phosphate acyltransferase [Elusimicrobia bacterium]|nr:phosphate acyltransferase [Elusimicrobiota bacterium]
MKRIPIALDAMGGDFGCEPLVKGALEALDREPNLEVHLAGVPKDLESALSKFEPGWRNRAIKIVVSSEAVGMGEGTFAIAKRRKDSSIAKCLELLKAGEVAGVMSAGSTTASVYWALEILGTYPDESLKPGLPIPWPNSRGATYLMDAGATPDADARQLAHFAVLGSLYAKAMLGRESVRVGLLSIGEERTKGNSKIKEAYRLIEKLIPNDFAGMVEGKDLPLGRVDVVICDAFVGNIALKLGEGFIEEAGRMLKKNLNWLGKLGGLLMLPSLKKLKKKLSWEAIGGAPLLGARGNLFIGHGRSSPAAIASGLVRCGQFAAIEGTAKIQEEYLRHYAALIANPGGVAAAGKLS